MADRKRAQNQKKKTQTLRAERCKRTGQAFINSANLYDGFLISWNFRWWYGVEKVE